MLQRDGRIPRAAIVDLDVHHGNGTAMIFERDDTVFTFSMHQQLNYPLLQAAPAISTSGSRTAPATCVTTASLGEALPRVMASRPDLIVYLAGADPYENDRLGGLRLSKAGLGGARSARARRGPPCRCACS